MNLLLLTLAAACLPQLAQAAPLPTLDSHNIVRDSPGKEVTAIPGIDNAWVEALVSPLLLKLQDFGPQPLCALAGT